MELLPLLLVLLAGTLAAGVEEIEMDMVPNSFDDQYLGCREEMRQQLPKLNHTEFATNSLYAQVWVNASTQWQKARGSRLRQEQTIALLAYTMDTDLTKEFDRAVREGGRSHREYLRKFDFKVLHFLITEALGDLRKADSCFHVYRGVPNIWFLASPGQIVRFGQFATTSTDINTAKGYGIGTIFDVYTCQGAKIDTVSIYPDEKEVLIPPFETFRVTSVTSEGDKTRIQIRSHGEHSKYNCAFSSGWSVHKECSCLAGLLLAALAMAVVNGTP